MLSNMFGDTSLLGNSQSFHKYTLISSLDWLVSGMKGTKMDLANRFVKLSLLRVV